MATTADDIMAQIRALPEPERRRLVERVAREVAATSAEAPQVPGADGLWADVSDDEYAAFEQALREARALPLRSNE